MANYRRAGLVWFALATVVFLLVAGCKGFFVNPTLTAITVAGSNGSTTPFVNVGATLQMVATGTFNDGSVSMITATWSSQAENIATVNQSTGVVTGVTPGTANIQAASNGITGLASVTVCGAITAITISPLNQIVTPGSQPLQYKATEGPGGPDITSQVTWSSSNTAVAQISTSGLATIEGAGNTTITAASCTLSASTGLTVQ